MKELYWISVIGSLDIWVATIAALGCIFTGVLIVLFIIASNDEYSDMKPEKMKSYAITSSIVFGIMILVSILLPSKDEMYVIYGVGTVIDYVRENPEAQKLPDKTIKFLNAVADDYLSKSESQENDTKEE